MRSVSSSTSAVVASASHLLVRTTHHATTRVAKQVVRQVHSTRAHHARESHDHLHEHLHLVLRLFFLTLEILHSGFLALELVHIECAISFLDSVESVTSGLHISEAHVSHTSGLKAILALLLNNLEGLDLSEAFELLFESFFAPVLRNELDVDVVLLPLLLEELEVTHLLDLAH